jgi:hypothetical protein
MFSLSPGQRETVKHIAPILMATASLVTALASFYRPETSARKVYDQHKADVEQLSKIDEHTQREVEQIRAYLVSEAAKDAEAPRFIVAEGSDAGVLAVPQSFDAGPGRAFLPVVVVHAPKAAPPVSSHSPVKGFSPVPYEAVTGSSDKW